MTRFSALVLVLGATLSVSPLAAAINFNVSNADQIETALETAVAGDTLIMTNGVWTDQEIRFAGIGTAGNPITLRAETPGGVILNGASQLLISGDHLVVDGLHFQGGTLENSDHVVQFRGPLGEATNSRFTNSVIESYYNPAELTDKWHYVSLYGQGNRVDHNRFLDQQNIGPQVVVWLDESATPISANHTIDANHFGDRPRGWENGFETIRLGDSDTSLVDANITVENNLFERVDGEIEIISSKSNNNVFRYNTFRDSRGTLTLRHGNNNTVEGNFFLGGDVEDSGGIRVVGEEHTIVNNYIANVGDEADGAISFAAGVPNSPLNGYAQVKDVTVAHNTIVNVGGAGITFDWGIGSSNRSLLPENLTIAGNLISGAGDSSFEGAEGTGYVYADNIAFGAALGIASRPGIDEVDPLLVQDADGLWRPAAGSPAIDAAAAAYVTVDMDGQARIGLFDIGADEQSFAQIVRKPLTTSDVGASWFNYLPPDDWGGPPPLPPGAYVVLEAEGFTAITDPDSDGNVWTVEQIAEASGGAVIKSPDGSRSDAPAHDTLALYDIVFGEAGDYTAYYLSRGFDGSSDSFFTPDDFGVDPDVIENVASNGEFRWETGDEFTIEAFHVGMPLEFRLGRREGDTEIDAIIFHQSSNLTPIQLDTLLAGLELAGDYNDSGLVEQGDLDQVLANWGADFDSIPVEWINQRPTEGIVDQAELDVVLQGWGSSSTPDFGGVDVPEPAGLAVVALGATLLARGRRVVECHPRQENASSARSAIG